MLRKSSTANDDGVIYPLRSSGAERRDRTTRLMPGYTGRLDYYARASRVAPHCSNHNGIDRQ